MSVYLTKDPIRLERFFSAMPESSCGAQASFVGIVRDHDHGRPVKNLYYECYAEMAERVLEQVALEAAARWPVHEVRILHRVGALEIGETAVAIAVSSAHRDEAFSACRFAIEQIKSKVPIWKKEFYADGTDAWVSCAHTVSL